MLDGTAWPRVRRLFRWLEQFHDCFHHQAQRLALRRYIHGVLGDSARKSMEAMLARVTDPGHYQALQHFITHAAWDVAPVWRRLLEQLPTHRGVLIIDDTGWPKQGKHSVGVARQYCGALGKVANCQVAVTTLLWAGQRAWHMIGSPIWTCPTQEHHRADSQRHPSNGVGRSMRWTSLLPLSRGLREQDVPVIGPAPAT